MSRLQGLIEKILFRFVDRRMLYEFFRNPKYSKPALNGIDDKLAKYLAYSGGFFIEVGANDGFTQSNTYYLENFLGWSGILIEPIPNLFEQCCRTRKNSVVFNCALVSNEHNSKAISMRYANLMSLTEGAFADQSIENEHISTGLKVQNIDESYKIDVPARTLESVLDDVKDKPATIDFFSLDVEGYELNVLKGLNLEKYRPRYLLLEDLFNTYELHSYLAIYYSLVEMFTDHDYFYQCKD
jgi:FkbM family methyltransferase